MKTVLLVLFMSLRRDTQVTLLSTRNQLETMGICSFKNILTTSQVQSLKELCIDNEYSTVKKFIQGCPNVIDAVQQQLSCLAPALADFTQGTVQDTDGVSGTGKQLFSKLVYGDSTFYDLPDAF